MSDLNTRIPSGNDVTQHFSLQPSFSENLLERTLQRENIQAAWKRVRANKGAAGIDGMTIEEFPDWVRSGQWERVMQKLRLGIYKPDPVRRVEIEKPDGGIRQLAARKQEATIKDRVIQQAIAQILTPISDPKFSNNSFGFRPNRNGQQAAKQVQSIIKEGRRFAVDVDLSKFFD